MGGGGNRIFNGHGGSTYRRWELIMREMIIYLGDDHARDGSGEDGNDVDQEGVGGGRIVWVVNFVISIRFLPFLLISHLYLFFGQRKESCFL